MTVGELLIAVGKFPLDWPVIATWEGTLKSISVYPGKDCVIVDADAEFYRDGLEGNLTRHEAFFDWGVE